MQIFFKNPLAIQRNRRIEHRMWQNNPNIIHVWNNFTEEGGGRGADLSNFGGEEPGNTKYKKASHEHHTLIGKVVSNRCMG